MTEPILRVRNGKKYIKHKKGVNNGYKYNKHFNNMHFFDYYENH